MLWLRLKRGGGRQFFLYVLVGGVAAVADLAVFAFLVQHVNLNYLLSVAVAFLAGTLINFFLCFKFVFCLRGHSPAMALWRKFLSGIFSLAMNLLMMFIMVDILAFDRMGFRLFGFFDGLLLARSLAIALAFIVNYVLTKYYAFRDY